MLDLGEGNLTEVVAAPGPCGGRPYPLDGRQEQADQDAEDRDDYHQLKQRVPGPE